MRVLRVYHGGRDANQRARERAMVAAGAELTLVVPNEWIDSGTDPHVEESQFEILEHQIRRSGDVNRHAYSRPAQLMDAIRQSEPDVLDIHEEPFSAAAHQWISAAPPHLPIAMYTAQNVDKRFPPPYSRYESRAYYRVSGLYPCSRQAASVARGKGFAGEIEVIPLGFDPSVFSAGSQSFTSDEFTIVFVGRFVPEKGVRDAVSILASVRAVRNARLVLAGEGPEKEAVLDLAASLGVRNRVDVLSWQSASELADLYRAAHVVLVPSTPTTTWVEQFGRVIVEAQASGAVVAGYASGAIPEVAGEFALLVSEGRTDLLADGVAELSADEAAWEARRDAGLELARSRTWDCVATRQLDLYRRTITDPLRRTYLPRASRERRRLAQVEFGRTASTVAGPRPFALPVLRRGGKLPNLLGRVIDIADAIVTSISAR
jgi:glycosyltransferase involved in cell wall biosynthesis